MPPHRREPVAAPPKHHPAGNPHEEEREEKRGWAQLRERIRDAELVLYDDPHGPCEIEQELDHREQHEHGHQNHALPGTRKTLANLAHQASMSWSMLPMNLSMRSGRVAHHGAVMKPLRRSGAMTLRQNGTVSPRFLSL